MKTFEISVPVIKTMVFVVEARSKKEALMLYHSSRGEVVQRFEFSGTTESGKVEVREIMNTKETKEENEKYEK